MPGTVTRIELQKIKEKLHYEHNMTGFSTVAKDLQKAIKAIDHAIQFIDNFKIKER